MSQSGGSRKHGLGRGLGALLVSTEEGSAPVAPQGGAQPDAGVQHVALERIEANPHQPRTQFDPALLEELAASIREHGIIQPLIVTETPDQVGRFWIIAGERRWRAARLAGLHAAPVIVREASSQQLVEWALVENVQRADLNPLEEAAAYSVLMDEFKLTQGEVAARVGKSRPAVANTVRLLQLPASLQEAVVNGALSAGHARALLALDEAARMEDAAAIVQRRALNVRQTEELVRQLLMPPVDSTAAEPDAVVDEHVVYLENRFRSALGTRVNLARNADGSGRLVVHFYNDDDLQHLLQRMAGDDEL